MTHGRGGGHYRGENIPTVEAYAHWNEDAERVWYEENKYDMQNADEWIEDPEDMEFYEDD